MSRNRRIAMWLVGLVLAGVVIYWLGSGQLMHMLLAMHGKHGG